MIIICNNIKNSDDNYHHGSVWRWAQSMNLVPSELWHLWGATEGKATIVVATVVAVIATIGVKAGGIAIPVTIVVTTHVHAGVLDATPIIVAEVLDDARVDAPVTDATTILIGPASTMVADGDEIQ